MSEEQRGLFIETWYVGPTDHRPGRVRARSMGSGRRLMVEWRHELEILENHRRAADKLAAECREWRAVAWTSTGDLRLGAIVAPPEPVLSGVDGRGYVFCYAIPESGPPQPGPDSELDRALDLLAAGSDLAAQVAQFETWEAALAGDYWTAEERGELLRVARILGGAR